MERVTLEVRTDGVIGLCLPAHYEITRGLVRVDGRRQIEKYRHDFVPMMIGIPLVAEDWDEAARLWAQAQRVGRQLSDMDLLIAAMAIRLDAVVVTADDDFNALPVKRENWRLAQPE